MNKVAAGLCFILVAVMGVGWKIEDRKKSRADYESRPLNPAAVEKILDNHNCQQITYTYSTALTRPISFGPPQPGVSAATDIDLRLGADLRTQIWSMAKFQREKVAEAQKRPELLQHDIVNQHIFVLVNPDSVAVKFLEKGGRMWKPGENEIVRKAIHYTFLGETHSTFVLSNDYKITDEVKQHSIMVFAHKNVPTDKIIVGYYDENMAWSWPGDVDDTRLDRKYGGKEYYGVITLKN